MDLRELKVFMMVASERSFSRAAEKLYRTQSAISQAVARLESELGERLFDRRTGTLTPAGRLLHQRGGTLMQLIDETEMEIRHLHEPTKRAIIIGANEAAVHPLLPILATFRGLEPDVEIDVRRTQARHIAEEVLAGALDFGIFTSQRVSSGLRTVTIGTDDLQVLVPPRHPYASRRRMTMEEFQEETIIAHNDPSPARDYVLRAFSDKGLRLSTMISLPSLDAIKRAVEMGLGIALLPRRCALAEITSRTLVAVPLANVSRSGAIRLAFRRHGGMTREAERFLAVAKEAAVQGTEAPSGGAELAPRATLSVAMPF